MMTLDHLQEQLLLFLMETLERHGGRVILAALSLVGCLVMVVAFAWALWRKE